LQWSNSLQLSVQLLSALDRIQRKITILSKCSSNCTIVSNIGSSKINGMKTRVIYFYSCMVLLYNIFSRNLMAVQCKLVKPFSVQCILVTPISLIHNGSIQISPCISELQHWLPALIFRRKTHLGFIVTECPVCSDIYVTNCLVCIKWCFVLDACFQLYLFWNFDGYWCKWADLLKQWYLLKPLQTCCPVLIPYIGACMSILSFYCNKNC